MTSCSESLQPQPGGDALLRVAVLSLDMVEGDVSANLRRARAMIDALPENTDVAVLPEMFTTSFMRDTDAMVSLADTAFRPTMEELALWSRERNSAIAGSVVARDGDRMVNRGFIVFPDREAVFYDKRHLFCLSPEARLLGAGKELPPVVNFRGWNLSMIICYDLRFPVWSRNVGQQTDLLIVPANWPRSRGYAWRQLLIARAIENQEVVVGANRGGEDAYGLYDGLSLIVDPMGVPVAPPRENLAEDSPEPMTAGETVETDYGTILTARFSLAEVRRLRRRMPVGRDADSFLIHDAL